MAADSNYLEDLKVIKKVMEESGRFLSLSGLSGVFAGLVALGGVAVAMFIVQDSRSLLFRGLISGLNEPEIHAVKIKLIADAGTVLFLALAGSIWLSVRKTIKKGLRIWTPVSKKLIISFLIPLLTGGIFIIALFWQNQWQLLIPSMLIFYGLALVNAGKFTYNDVFYLGLVEILTGLVSIVFPAYGILLWGFGFGLLHITYGLILYRKYEA